MKYLINNKNDCYADATHLRKIMYEQNEIISIEIKSINRTKEILGLKIIIIEL
jgi:hypothetical protein